jgi:GDP-L-fucose synthase
MDKSAKIYIAGHRGMVGSSLVRLFEKEGYRNLLTASSAELDLRNTEAVKSFFERNQPEYVFLAAAKVGGIKANNAAPADFLYDNLMVQCNVIHQSYLSKVKKLVFFGSSCIYPRECPQPMREDHLLTGPLEPTNEGYALAKIAGFKMSYFYAKQHGMDVLNIMPCNLYGTNDHFDLDKAHVLSSLVRRFVDAVDNDEKIVTCWGTGTPRREFLHVDDLATATMFLLKSFRSSELINVGSGFDVTIRELAETIAKEAAFSGEIRWNPSMPDGMMKKCLDVSKIASLGFAPAISLSEGIKQTIAEYRALKNSRMVKV